MMEIALVYLLHRAWYRLTEFFRHWYIDGFFRATHVSLGVLERLDRFFALRITVKNWFQPLYQDYTIIGYLWGFIFRSIRIAIGLIVYFAFVVLSTGVFLFWASLPLSALYYIFVIT